MEKRFSSAWEPEVHSAYALSHVNQFTCTCCHNAERFHFMCKQKCLPVMQYKLQYIHILHQPLIRCVPVLEQNIIKIIHALAMNWFENASNSVNWFEIVLVEWLQCHAWIMFFFPKIQPDLFAKQTIFCCLARMHIHNTLSSAHTPCFAKSVLLLFWLRLQEGASAFWAEATPVGIIFSTAWRPSGI